MLRMNAGSPIDYSFDEVRIGTSWKAVTGGDVLLDGDYNGDGKVDAADYVVWRKDPGSFGGDPGGYNTWSANFGATSSGSAATTAVPEPGSLLLAVMAVVGCGVFVAARRPVPRKVIATAVLNSSS